MEKYNDIDLDLLGEDTEMEESTYEDKEFLSEDEDVVQEIANETGMELEEVQLVSECVENFGVVDGIVSEASPMKFRNSEHKAAYIDMRQNFATRSLIIGTAKAKNDALYHQYVQAQKKARAIYAKMKTKYGKSSKKQAVKMVKAAIKGNTNNLTGIKSMTTTAAKSPKI